MRVLITGSSGFAGTHLAAWARAQKGVRVFDLECDIRDAKAVRRTLLRVRPDRIFHLAGQAFVPEAWKDPITTLEVNALGAVNLLEAARSLSKGVRILIAGSADEYGSAKDNELPIREEHDLSPHNPYGVSKVAQELLAVQYHRHQGLWIVCTRAFNHIGPGQDPKFAVSDFARQIARIEAGRQKPVLKVGDLRSVRDLTDVRDVARAYWLALERGKPGRVYNIAGNRGVGLRQVVRILIGLSGRPIAVRIERSRLRRTDMPVKIGSAARLRRDTGWRPRIPLARTLEDVLQYWRENEA